MQPRAELDFKSPSRPAGPASEPGQIPPGSGGLRPVQNLHIRPVWDPGRRPREQVPGVPREQRRRGRRPISAPRPQADQPGPCGGARQGRKTREGARRPRSPTGPPLAPAGRPPKAPTVTTVAGPGAGLREGRGPTPDSGARAPGGGIVGRGPRYRGRGSVRGGSVRCPGLGPARSSFWGRGSGKGGVQPI